MHSNQAKLKQNSHDHFDLKILVCFALNFLIKIFISPNFFKKLCYKNIFMPSHVPNLLAYPVICVAKRL